MRSVFAHPARNPKFKMYFAAQGSTNEEAQARIAALTQDVMARIDAYIEPFQK
ncbi:hypothetical protein ACXFAU_02790 [Paenibacillus glucanolyticus]